MTIVVSVKARDGLILGTDSMTQVLEGTEVVKSYTNARKLFQIADKPIGVMTWGLGNVGLRSIEGIVFDFSQTHAGKFNSVKEVADGLAAFIQQLYEAEFETTSPPSDRPFLGFLVAGYSPQGSLPEEWECWLPSNPQPWQPRPPHQIGAIWRGVTDPFSRLYMGADPQIEPRLRAKNLTDEDIAYVLGGLPMSIDHIVGMPLQDAINFAVFILETTIGWSSFHTGNPTCSHPLQVAVILPDDGFQWITRPHLRVLSAQQSFTGDERRSF